MIPLSRYLLYDDPIPVHTAAKVMICCQENAYMLPQALWKSFEILTEKIVCIWRRTSAGSVCAIVQKMIKSKQKHFIQKLYVCSKYF